MQLDVDCTFDECNTSCRIMSSNKMQWIDLDHQQSKPIKELRLIPKDSKGGSKLPHNPDMRAKRSHKKRVNLCWLIFSLSSFWLITTILNLYLLWLSFTATLIKFTPSRYIVRWNNVLKICIEDKIKNIFGIYGIQIG